MTNGANSTPANQTTIAAVAVGATVGLASFVFRVPIFGAIILGSGAALLTKKVIDAQGA